MINIEEYFLMELSNKIPIIGVNPLVYVLENIKPNRNGLFLEFGTGTGKTANYISKHCDKLYTFDCFQGLPEKWRDGFEAGSLSMNGVIPEVNNNIEIIAGYFNDTVKDFISNKKQNISFIHMDADLYSSTIDVLEMLKEYMKDTIIVFDEMISYIGYHKSKLGELSAFYDFINNNKEFSYTWIGCKSGLVFRSVDKIDQVVALRLTRN